MGSLLSQMQTSDLPCARIALVTPPGQFGLEEVRMACKTLLALSFLGSLSVVGCGGSGSGMGGGIPTPPPTASVTSVAVSCVSATVNVGQTSQCSVTVQGTGSYSSAVNWAVNSVAGGNATVGTVSTSGLYTAPAAVPMPFTVALTATSATDITKSASSPLIVAGTIASVFQTISASAGGTITLPDGSSVAIPAGLLAADETVTLTEASILPKPPPDDFVAGVGTALQLTFSTPIQPSTRFRITPKDQTGARSSASSGDNASSALTFTINQEQVSSGLNGAIGLGELVDTTNTTSYFPTTYSANDQTSSLAVQSALLSGLQNPISSLSVSAANNAFLVIPTGLPLSTLPKHLCWQPGTSTSTGTWTDFSNCSSQISGKRVLVVVHGMMSCVENTFTGNAFTTFASQMLANQTYGAIVGFDYDWTQHLTTSGGQGQLETFLEQIAQLGPTSIDIVAHSEGVPVALYAASQTPDRALIRNLFSLAGPILGTPVSEDGVADLALYAHYRTSGGCPSSQAIQGLGLDDLFQAPFVQDLLPGSDALTKTILPSVRNNLGNANIFVAGGTNSDVGTGELGLGSIYQVNGSPFGATPNDGIVGLDSALAYDAHFSVHPFPPFPTLTHTDLPSDPGVLNDIRTEVSQNSPPQLDCVSTSDNCDGAQDDLFTLVGTGFGSSGSNVQLYSQDSTGAVRLLPSSTLVDSGGTITWPMPLDTQTTGLFSVFAFDSTLTLASNNVMQTVGPPTSPTIAVTISPMAVTLAPGGTQLFSAVVNGTTNTAVTWNVNGSIGGDTIVGTISAAGLYTAPATVPNPITVTVTATSQADASVSGSASVTVEPTGVVIISPTTVSVPEGAVQTFFASVSGGGAVNWSVEGGASGSIITSAGLYTAPNSTGTFHVVATSVSDSSQSAKAVVAVVAGPVVTTMHSFDHSTEGANPWAAPVFGSDGNLYGVTEAGGDLSCGYISSLAGCGTIYESDTSGNVTTLYSFSGTDGAYPGASLTQTPSGAWYGTTVYGGLNTSECVAGGTSTPAGCGTVFNFSASTGFTSIYSFGPFSSLLGVGPDASLTENSSGVLYGANEVGGNTICTGTIGAVAQSGCGSIFSIDTSNVFAPLHTFSGSEGAYPAVGLLQQSDGNFYGTTAGGGVLTCSSYATLGCGTVFQMSSTGAVKTLHTFTQQDGAAPDAKLILGSDGMMYGTTLFGGTSSCSGGAPWRGCGTVFKIDSAGNFTLLHTFSGTDGAYPAQLMQAADGYFYGTTEGGGDASCTGRYGPGCGTVFKLDSAGNVTVLYSFTGQSDGSWPESALIQGSDGNLYGTTAYGGVNDDGVIFKISNLATLASAVRSIQTQPFNRQVITPLLEKRPHLAPPRPARPKNP